MFSSMMILPSGVICGVTSSDSSAGMNVIVVSLPARMILKPR